MLTDREELFKVLIVNITVAVHFSYGCENLFAVIIPDCLAWIISIGFHDRTLYECYLICFFNRIILFHTGIGSCYSYLVCGRCQRYLDIDIGIYIRIGCAGYLDLCIASSALITFYRFDFSCFVNRDQAFLICFINQLFICCVRIYDCFQL